MDSQLARDAIDLLATLDQEQRNDLSVHLYSAHLLKHLLYRANKDEKNILRTETFVKTVLKEDWTAWPSRNSIIDPNTSDIYEDQAGCLASENIGGIHRKGVQPGQLDQSSLNHATEMLYGELNAFWQQKLKESSVMGQQTENKTADEGQIEDPNTIVDENDSEILGVNDTALDVNEMDLPDDIFQNLLFKVDRFIGSLHLDAAETNTVTLSTIPSEPEIKLKSTTIGNTEAVTTRSKEKYDYKDIIVHGCETGEDMSRQYLRAIDLFQDLPKTMDKSQFVLPDAYLDRFSQVNLGNSDSEQSDDDPQDHTKLEENIKKKENSGKKDVKSFVDMKRIIKDRNNDPVVRRETRLLLRKDEFARDKKMFFTVLNHQNSSEQSNKPRRRIKKRDKNNNKNIVSLNIDSDYGPGDLD
ncbi:Rrn9p [Kluyveromyces lactis]|uniref:KLLA0D01947p n=1 Tax=Kluyveromyces lactis (strain ATCC 8585 / CBS 2359 / DSM 70799 / NBRC 1267 / NRRL Y-1140 / WM37) TaxID=284590 RepID=Q6CSD5_KLULA|nr:uncharacterized protein KLLA0_D01947g [Kluyveromyces lactis]CAH00250.1 KLLA0D01947p [Kluyveromyces lactis]|eukprot:XP_453154.1 uncharacterized protein KLLA0_D01947g [Kluyveromyces lactis]